MPPASKGLTAHYFFTFGVEVQLVGDRKNTRVEHRILHLDVAAAALKLVQKGSVVVFLRFDSINQIVFDDAEPRSVLISCRDDRRFFVEFQSSEDNLVFRTACADLAAKDLDLERFQRQVLRKGQVLKRGKAGALFGDRYAILTPRKLFVLASKVSVFPSNAISLQEVSPRYDDVKGTIHLDVCGKEYVFQGTDKDSSQDWFVDIARAATSKVPILAWDEAEATRMRQAAAAEAAGVDVAGGDADGGGGGVDPGGYNYYPDGGVQGGPGEVELISLSGSRPGPGGGHTRHSQGPSHFTAPTDWVEQEELDVDHHTEQLAFNSSSNGAAAAATAAAAAYRGGGGGGASLPRSLSGSSSRTGMGQDQQQQQRQQRQQQRAIAATAGSSGNGGRTSNAAFSNNALAPASAGFARSWSGNSSNRAAAVAVAAAPRRSLQPQQQQQQQQQRRGFNPPVDTGVLGPGGGGRWGDASSNTSTPRSGARSPLNLGSSQGLAPQVQSGLSGTNGSSRSGSGGGGAGLGSGSLAGSALDTIYEVAENDAFVGSGGPSQPTSGAEDAAVMEGGEPVTADEEAMMDSAEEQEVGYEEQQMQQQLMMMMMMQQQQQEVQEEEEEQQQQQPLQRVPAPPPAPPLRPSKLRAMNQARHQQQQQQQQRVAPKRSSVKSGAHTAAAAAAAASNRLARQQQQAAAAAAAIADQEPQHTLDQQPGRVTSAAVAAAAAAAAAAIAAASADGSSNSHMLLQQQQQQVSLHQHSLAATGGFTAPSNQVDLGSITDAVAARLMAQQQQQQKQQQQMHELQASQYNMFADQLPHHIQQQQQLQQQLQQQFQQQGQQLPYGAVPLNINNGTSSNSSSPLMMLHPLIQQPNTPPAFIHGSPWSTVNPAAAATAPASSSSLNPSPGSTVNYGSGSGVLGQSGGWGQGGSNPGSRPDSAQGWGRKSLAGLYSSTASIRSAPQPPLAAAAAAATAAAVPGPAYVGFYGTPGSNSSIPWGDSMGLQQPGMLTTAAAAAALDPAALAGSSGSRISLGAGAAAAAAAAGKSRHSSSAVASPAATTAAISISSSNAGVVYGEYIIPSVFKVIVECPEGRELAMQLRQQGDQLTPHQRCLALLRWAFAVYRQLPPEARTAIPSGPKRRNLKAWAAPNMVSLTQAIQTTQLKQQQQKRQQEAVLRQQQQQEQAQKQQQLLQETVLKQQEQLGQLMQLLTHQPSGESSGPADLGAPGLNPRASNSNSLDTPTVDGVVNTDGNSVINKQLLSAAAGTEGCSNWSSYLDGFKAAADTLTAAAAAAASVAAPSTADSPAAAQGSVALLQQLLQRRQQNPSPGTSNHLQQQQPATRASVLSAGLPSTAVQAANRLPLSEPAMQQLLQLVTAAASSSGAQTAAAVAAATAAAGAARALPAESIAALLQEAAQHMMEQQQLGGQHSKQQRKGHPQHNSTQRQSSRSCSCCWQEAGHGVLKHPEGRCCALCQQSNCACAGASCRPRITMYRASNGSISTSSSCSCTDPADEAGCCPAGSIRACADLLSPRLPQVAVSVRLKPVNGLPAQPCASCDAGAAAQAARKGPDGMAGDAAAAVSAGAGANSHSSSSNKSRVQGSVRPLGHRLKGKCSFTCDNPLFQIDMVPQEQQLRGVDLSGETYAAALERGSSGRRSSGGRCSAVYLSQAAAETICQAAAAAASAAAAAVRSAVVTLDRDEEQVQQQQQQEVMTHDADVSSAHVDDSSFPVQGQPEGVEGVMMRPHSIESLVGQMQSGSLDSGEFVATVAAGRAGPLLRSQHTC